MGKWIWKGRWRGEDGEGKFENKPSPQQRLKLKGKTLEQLLWIKRGYEM